MKEIAEEELRQAYSITEKQKRREMVEAVRQKVLAELLPPDNPAEAVLLADVFKSLEQEIVRGNILQTGKRIDGRDLKSVRPIMAQVGVLPRGSALFTRGETQALVVATLGTGENEQYVDTLEARRSASCSYNFRPSPR